MELGHCSSQVELATVSCLKLANIVNNDYEIDAFFYKLAVFNTKIRARKQAHKHTSTHNTSLLPHSTSPFVARLTRALNTAAAAYPSKVIMFDDGGGGFDGFNGGGGAGGGGTYGGGGAATGGDTGYGGYTAGGGGGGGAYGGGGGAYGGGGGGDYAFGGGGGGPSSSQNKNFGTPSSAKKVRDTGSTEV